MSYRAFLNQEQPLVQRLQSALASAQKLDIAVAYANTSGVVQLLEHLPSEARAVIGLGFALTDPEAVEMLSTAGASVRVVTDSPTLRASQFHPKLYIVTRRRDLIVFSGSANLTGSGLRNNVEQYDELLIDRASDDAILQQRRFAALWEHGRPLDSLQSSGEWKAYHDAVTLRRAAERNLRQVRTGVRKPVAGRRYSARERGRLPGWIGITDEQWWEHQRTRRYLNGPVFMRAGASGRFRRLEPGGMFFYLVRRAGQREEERAVEGLSLYGDQFEIMTRAASWRRYGSRVGYEDRHGYVRNKPDEQMGLILLEQVRTFRRPITLRQLRESDVGFSSNIEQGRGLSADEVAIVLRLGEGYA
jgi:HKD family nuclease